MSDQTEKIIKNRKRVYQEDLPLLSVMNTGIYGVIRWCTPSLHPGTPRVNGIYESDISISYHGLGNPSLNTGIFKKAHDLAAKAYHAEHTLFSVNGSTGSNFIVLRALKHQLGRINILAQRNIHKSISAAVEDYRLDINFVEPVYDDDLQIFIPNSVGSYIEALKRYPQTNVLLVTNPTYEGFTIDLENLVKEVRKFDDKIIIFVDEAWGAHFPFSKRLPISAMEAGADISVQSVHKQGSGLQQTSMIHWQGKRTSEKYIMDSYKTLMTTSPSFHLLASMDGTRHFMESKGETVINDLLKISNFFRERLETVSGVKIVESEDIFKKYPQIKDADESKILVNIKKTGLSGFDIAHSLENKHKIIVEKYEANNILFITTMQNGFFEVERTIESLRNVISELKKNKKDKRLTVPKFPTKVEKVLNSYNIVSGKAFSERTKLTDSLGKISAEDVVPYPPGIPLIMKGEMIKGEHIEYLKNIKKSKNLISVVIDDKNIDTILTVSKFGLGEN